MTQNVFFESYINKPSTVTIEMNNQLFHVDKKAVEQNGRGGILDILFKQKASKVANGEVISLVGDREKARQLQTYINYLHYEPFFITEMTLEAIAQEVMDLVCCGVDLPEALDHYGAKEAPGDVVGEMLILMSESFVTTLLNADERGAWKNILAEGVEWVCTNHPEQVTANADLFATIYQKYNNFSTD